MKRKVFPDVAKTGVNVKKEMSEIFKEYKMPEDRTPTTTDQGSNMVAALSKGKKIPFMAHRLSTVLDDAWQDAKNTDPAFDRFDSSVISLVAFVNHSGGVNHRLPVSVKSFSGTRSWRSYFEVPNSILQSYDPLRKVLIEKGAEDKLMGISVSILKNTVAFFKEFNKLFDRLEMSNAATLQNVVPTLFAILGLCKADDRDQPVTALLKEAVLRAMKEKYFTSLIREHHAATYLDPTFRTFSCIQNSAERTKLLKVATECVFDYTVFLTEAESEAPNTQEAANNGRQRRPPGDPINPDDPFAHLRDITPRSNESSEDDTYERLRLEMTSYSAGKFERTSVSVDPLQFWEKEANQYPLLSAIARKILVIPATSAESERHFSRAGKIVTEERSQLDPEAVDSLVSLNDAALCGIW